MNFYFTKPINLYSIDDRVEQLFHQTYHSGRRVERLLELNQIDQLLIDGDAGNAFPAVVQLQENSLLLPDPRLGGRRLDADGAH